LTEILLLTIAKENAVQATLITLEAQSSSPFFFISRVTPSCDTANADEFTADLPLAGKRSINIQRLPRIINDGSMFRQRRRSRYERTYDAYPLLGT